MIPFVALDEVSHAYGGAAGTLAVDLRDNPIAPRKGFYFAVNANEGTKYLGGNYQYLQLTPEVRAYVGTAETVLAARLRVGMILGDVPPTERYYSGGASSQRGFSERALSPFASAVGRKQRSGTTMSGHSSSTAPPSSIASR